MKLLLVFNFWKRYWVDLFLFMTYFIVYFFIMNKKIVMLCYLTIKDKYRTIAGITARDLQAFHVLSQHPVDCSQSPIFREIVDVDC